MDLYDPALGQWMWNAFAANLAHSLKGDAVYLIGNADKRKR